MAAYYNEYDKKTAAWLRELIRRKLIADGEVDDRSIVDVRAADLRGFTQCHFFAGIGGWSHALRLAGWPADRPVWTASLPCQPFSAAGARQGHADERHLAPVWLRLAAECRPAICFGEQVGAAVGMGWLDALFISLEQSGYACGAAVFPACSVGAPHIRERLYWCAVGDAGWPQGSGDVEGRGESSELAHANGRDSSAERQQRSGEQRLLKASGKRLRPIAECGDLAEPVWMADASSEGTTRGFGREGGAGDARATESAGGGSVGVMGDAIGSARQELRRDGIEYTQDASRGLSATNGFWRNAEWLPCRDGKARPVEPGTFPLAHGVPARVGRLRGYGNAIVAPQAAEFIAAYMEIA